MRIAALAVLAICVAGVPAAAAAGKLKIYPLPDVAPRRDGDLPPAQPAFYVSVSGFADLVITDAAGKAHPVLPSEAEIKAIAHLDPRKAEEKLAHLMQGPPHVSVQRDSPDSGTLILSRFVRHTIAFKSGGGATALTVSYGFGAEESAALTIRYQDTDLALAKGEVARIELSPKGITPLVVTGGGRRRVLAPTAVLTGFGNQDHESPVVTIKQARDAGGIRLTILASDDRSGVRAIRFSTDGRMFRPYTGPVLLTDRSIRSVQAFADDKAGNRSHDRPVPLEW